MQAATTVINLLSKISNLVSIISQTPSIPSILPCIEIKQPLSKEPTTNAASCKLNLQIDFPTTDQICRHNISEIRNHTTNITQEDAFVLLNDVSVETVQTLCTFLSIMQDKYMHFIATVGDTDNNLELCSDVNDVNNSDIFCNNSQDRGEKFRNSIVKIFQMLKQVSKMW